MNFKVFIFSILIFFIALIVFVLILISNENLSSEILPSKIIVKKNPQVEDSKKTNNSLLPVIQNIEINKFNQNNAKEIDNTKDTVEIIAEISTDPNDSVIKEEVLHKPVFGKGLSPSSSKAYFLIHDAKGKLLEPNIVQKARLWRNVRNDLWHEEKAEFNHTLSRVECMSVDSPNLEPGYYALEIDGGGYGILKINFNLLKDEDYSAIYAMPNFSKIVVVQFIDQDGKNAKYTQSIPAYQWQQNDSPFNHYKAKEILVLRDPPHDFIFSGGRRSAKSISGTRSNSDIVYQPENGRYYLRVFSGQEGSIIYKFSKSENSMESFVLESKFTDNKNDLIVIQLKDSPLIDANTLVYKIDGRKNSALVGYNLNEIRVPAQETKVNFNYAQKGISYLIKGTKHSIQLEYQLNQYLIKNIEGDDFLFQYNFDKFEVGNELNVRFTDKKLYETPWENIIIGENELISKEAILNLKEFQVNFLLSPTFFEMAKNASEILGKKNSFKTKVSEKGIIFTSLFNADTTISEETFLNPKFVIKSNISLNKTTKGIFNPESHSDKKQFKFAFNISENAIRNSVNHEVDISPIQNTLILRAINQMDSGIPWVEASLIAMDEFEYANEVKTLLSDSVHSQYLEKITADSQYSDISSQLQSYIKGDKEVIKTNEELNNLIKIFSDTLPLKYYLDNGTWYNSSVKSVSDSRGYLVLSSDKLIAGKKYKLFLWCQSQTEFKPDKEISFIAQTGITDLGVIVFE